MELLPHSIDDVRALVRAALRATDLATAERTLQLIAERVRQVPRYHAAVGRTAEIAPNEAGFQTQVALVRLKSSDEENARAPAQCCSVSAENRSDRFGSRISSEMLACRT